VRPQERALAGKVLAGIERKMTQGGNDPLNPWLTAAFVLWALGRASDHLLRTTRRLRIDCGYELRAGNEVAAGGYCAR
jgi:hypothetical protein